MKEAQLPLDPTGWCMLVLTLDRDGYYSGQPWTDVNEAYKSLGKMVRATLGRIGRIWGPETALERGGRSGELRTVRKLGNRWIAVVEAHRSGWPHVNLSIWCPELAAELRETYENRLVDDDVANAVALARDAWKNKEPVPQAVRAVARKATVVGGDLEDLIVRSGWGRESTAEAARDIEAVLAYSAKIAGLNDASWGEIAKITQAPLNAPIRFRRYRSGKGFLPPRHHDETITGVLVRRKKGAYRFQPGTTRPEWEIQQINEPKDPVQLQPIALAVKAELAFIDEEEAMLARNRGKLPPLPPVRIVVAGAAIKDVEAFVLSRSETKERAWAASVRARTQCA